MDLDAALTLAGPVNTAEGLTADALRVLAAEVDRRSAVLAERDAEITRLRHELESFDVLTDQGCPAGKHPDWLIDSERHHACPWCEIERLRHAARASVEDLESPAMPNKARARLLDALAAVPDEPDDDIPLPQVTETGRRLVCVEPAELDRLRAVEQRARALVEADAAEDCNPDGPQCLFDRAFDQLKLALAAASAPAEDECADCGDPRSDHDDKGVCRRVIRPLWDPDDECWCGRFVAPAPARERTALDELLAEPHPEVDLTPCPCGRAKPCRHHEPEQTAPSDPQEDR